METNAQDKPKISVILDKLVYAIGTVVSWLSVALIVVIIVQVIMRYGFGKGSVILEEFQWHFYGIILIIAISYTLVENKHIRLDVLHCRFSPRTKAIVDFLGILLLLLPMVWVLFDNSLNLLSDSWRVNERSDAPLGLCCRWAFKGFLTLGMGLFGLAAISRLLQMARLIKRGDPQPGEACHVPNPEH